METEDHFLFVGYTTKPLPDFMDKETGKQVIAYIPVVKRATIRKPRREISESQGLIFKRTPIEFDPMDKQMGYVVVLHTKLEDRATVIKQDFHFPVITETQEEAEEAKKRLLGGEFKDYLIKGQKLDSVEVQPILIAEN